VHLVFMVGLGGLGLLLVTRAFDRYKASWEQKLRTLPVETLFSPMATEVARSLLLKLERGPSEPREQVRATVAEGLDKILPTLPSIERLIILDPEQRIQYADETLALGLTVRDAEFATLLDTDEPVREKVRLGSGQEVTQVVLPLFDHGPGEEGEAKPRRLGTALVQYRSDARLGRTFAELYGQAPGEGDEPPAVDHLLDPWVSTVSRSLLAEMDRGDSEHQEDYKVGISDGLNKLMSALPMEQLVIVDRDRRIQYVNDPEYLDLTYTDEEYAALFASERALREEITLDSGKRGVRVMLPVFDQSVDAASEEPPRRLGSVLIDYQPDPGLPGRIPVLSPPVVGPWGFIQPLILFFAMAVGGGILLAALTGLPVRRMERALADFRARGFKGGLDPKQVRVPADMATTVATISELGGRLEALDAQGREREALLETLSQSLEDGMVAVDPEGVPMAWNPAALRILLASPGASSGNGTKRPTEAERVARALERNSDLRFAVNRVEIGRTREVEIVRGDGSRALARVTQVPFELRPGVTGALLLIRDLAALRQVETHLLDAGRFAVLAHLAASLAHEIRNPLHAIQLNATVVEQYAGNAPDDKRSRAVSESVVTIKEEAQRLTDLLNNYLGMVRPGHEFGPVDLSELSRRVLQLVSYAARKSHVEVDLAGDEHPPVVVGEANRLQQAILNLVLNAIQAMPDGGKLTVRTDTYANMARVIVSDTGPGLPQELADQLFDTRVTTKSGGSGLGLPLVRLIVEAHGGGVWYRSSPGHGAAFTLVLPTQPEAH
jgi:PAS domain S-box-containing protein